MYRRAAASATAADTPGLWKGPIFCSSVSSWMMKPFSFSVAPMVETADNWVVGKARHDGLLDVQTILREDNGCLPRRNGGCNQIRYSRRDISHVLCGHQDKVVRLDYLLGNVGHSLADFSMVSIGPDGVNQVFAGSLSVGLYPLISWPCSMESILIPFSLTTS